MRHEGYLDFIPNHPGSQRGKYALLEWQEAAADNRHVTESKGASYSNSKFDDFKKWLTKNNVKAGVEAYVARLRMFENGLGASVQNILRDNGLKPTVAKVDSNVFANLVPGTRNAMKTAIRKYETFLKSKTS